MNVEEIVRGYRSIRNYLQRKMEAQAAALGLMVYGIGFGLSKLFETGLTEVATNSGSHEWQMHLAILLLSLLSAVAYLFVKRRDIFKRVSLPSRPIGEKLTTVKINSLSLLKIIQEEVVPEIFGTATPPKEMIYESFKKNPCRSIGLYSKDEQKFVGFASFWPITEEAAKKLMDGTKTEEDLQVEDMLPAAENATAKFALIPGVGVIDPETKKGFKRGLKLMLYFRQFLKAEYFGDPERSITVLAMGYTNDGEKWCQRLHLEKITMVKYPDDTWYPLFAKQVTRRGLDDFVDEFADAV